MLKKAVAPNTSAGVKVSPLAHMVANVTRFTTAMEAKKAAWLIDLRRAAREMESNSSCLTALTFSSSEFSQFIIFITSAPMRISLMVFTRMSVRCTVYLRYCPNRRENHSCIGVRKRMAPKPANAATPT